MAQDKSFPPSTEATLWGAENGPFQMEKALTAWAQQREGQGMAGRELAVGFESLRVVGKGVAASYQSTVGSILNPVTLLQYLNLLRRPPLRNIISGFYGVINPGEMLLVLGQPGAGCSTFLKTLANHRSDYHAVEGTVQYSAFSWKDMANHYRADLNYCPEDDMHFPTLTVEQTLDFAVRTRMPQRWPDRMNEPAQIHKLVRSIAAIVGLTHVLKVRVGDAMIRGVSGGEKKRVSIAEGYASRAVVHLWDNATRGLDSSTALEFGKTIRAKADIFKVATAACIYQAGEPLYRQFDKVCVIAEGRMIYFGPAATARDYFIEMGFDPPHRQTTADFLVAVTDPNERTARPGWENRVPRTVDEFVSYYDNSPTGQANRAAVEAFKAKWQKSDNAQFVDEYNRSVRMEQSAHAPQGSPYTLSLPKQTHAVLRRRWQITIGNWQQLVIDFCFNIFLAIVVGTLFTNTPKATEGFFSRGGIIFFGVIAGPFMCLTEIPQLFVQRPIVARHHKAALYHPFTEAVALTVVDIPFTFITQIVFSIAVYFISGLQRTAGQFFIFFLFVFMLVMSVKAMYRSAAAAFTRESGAITLAGMLLFLLTLYTGYTIPRPTIIKALRWITWLNPYYYGFEALMSNEFHNLEARCSDLLPSGPGYENVSIQNQVCRTVSAEPGQFIVNGARFIAISFHYTFSHTWRNFGIVLGFLFFFVCLFFFFTEFNTKSAYDVTVTLFKRGASTTPAVQELLEPVDEEKGGYTKQTGSQQSNSTNASSTSENKAPSESEPEPRDVFTWQHISYEVRVGGSGVGGKGGNNRHLLDDVSGFVAPGKLTALMGESGAGKTTLLNVLSERETTGVVYGDRFFNGQPLPSDFQAQTGYCQQMDTHLPETTVREALLFSAKLRQPQSVPLAEKEAYVQECLRMCGLEAYADAIVGSLGVEHRKRTTIGVELAAKPKLLLFLDEPTSGLDSQSAWAIVNFLRMLADKGQAILCTIHQPSSELFEIFDKLLLLRKGGQTVYFGDLGQDASTMITYFERNGAPPCPPDANPAEWMLDVIGAGATATSETDWYAVWQSAQESKDLQDEIEKIHACGRSRPPVQATFHSTFSAPWPYQVVTLLRRTNICYWRNPSYMLAKIILNIASGLLIGFTYFMPDNTQIGTQNMLFSFYVSLIIALPLSGQMQNSFVKFRSIWEVREGHSRTYHWSAFLVSHVLTEIPWNIVGSTLFFLCLYWTVGFSSSRAAYTWFMYSVLFPLYYTSLSLGTVAIAPNALTGGLFFTVLWDIAIIFNGTIQPYRRQGWWKWVYRISPLSYILEGLVGQALGHQSIGCASDEFVTIEPPSGNMCIQYMQRFIQDVGGFLSNPDATSDCQFCPFSTTDQYLDTSFSMKYTHRWRDVGVTIGFILFNIFFYFLFTYVARVRTRRH